MSNPVGIPPPPLGETTDRCITRATQLGAVQHFLQCSNLLCVSHDAVNSREHLEELFTD